MNEIARMMKIRAWADQIEEWRCSGKTQAAFARSHGITRDTFKYRKRQVEEYALAVMKGEITMPEYSREDVEMPHEEEQPQMMQEDIIQYPEERTEPHIVKLPVLPMADTEESEKLQYTIEISLSTCILRATNEADDELLRVVIRELRYA